MYEMGMNNATAPPCVITDMLNPVVTITGYGGGHGNGNGGKNKKSGGGRGSSYAHT
jgi:hypothetical protein